VDYASGDVRFLLQAYGSMSRELGARAQLEHAISSSRAYADQARLLAASTSAPPRVEYAISAWVVDDLL
jgi:ribonuclease D